MPSLPYSMSDIPQDISHDQHAVRLKKLQDLRAAGARILGTAGDLMPSEPGVPVHGHFSEGLLLSLLHRIGGGTSEIQRDVIGRGLGLPK